MLKTLAVRLNYYSGNKHAEHTEINSCFQKIYSKLYTSGSVMINYMLDYTTLQAGKSQGPDGFPCTILKKFAKELTPILLSVYDETLDVGSLPPTMCKAFISLIPKRDKPPCPK